MWKWDFIHIQFKLTLISKVSTKTRFEEEAKGNSEMAFCSCSSCVFRERIVVKIIAWSLTTHQIRHSPYTSRRTCFGMSKTGKPTFLKHTVYLHNSLRKKFKLKHVTTKHWNTNYSNLYWNYLESTCATSCSNKSIAIWEKAKCTNWSLVGFHFRKKIHKRPTTDQCFNITTNFFGSNLSSIVKASVRKTGAHRL